MTDLLKNMPEKVLKLKLPKTGQGKCQSQGEIDEFERKIIQSFKSPAKQKQNTYTHSSYIGTGAATAPNSKIDFAQSQPTSGLSYIQRLED